MQRPTLRAVGGASVAGAALLPVAWLILRGLDAGGVGELLEVMTRDRWGTLLRSLALSFGVAAIALAVSLPAAWLTEATDRRTGFSTKAQSEPQRPSPYSKWHAL